MILLAALFRTAFKISKWSFIGYSQNWKCHRLRALTTGLSRAAMHYGVELLEPDFESPTDCGVCWSPWLAPLENSLVLVMCAHPNPYEIPTVLDSQRSMGLIHSR